MLKNTTIGGVRKSYRILSEALPRDSAQPCECCGEGQHSPGGPEAWKERNSVNTCSIETSEDSIDIYAKSGCQWSGHSIALKPEL